MDRDAFAKAVTAALTSHPGIEIVREEVVGIPEDGHRRAGGRSARFRAAPSRRSRDSRARTTSTSSTRLRR